MTGWVARRGAVRRAGFALAVLLLLGILSSPLLEWRARPRGTVRLTMLDVGQGEALVLQTGGHALLVDAGGGSATFDVGRRVIAPALWALGVRRLDYLAITHPDLDHIGGAATVATMFRPAEIWEGVPVSGDPEWRTLRGVAQTQGIAWRQLQRGDRVEFGAVSMHVLHPPPPDWERPRVRNDDSLVFQVRVGLVELLLAGDVGASVEEGLPLEAARRGLRVLKIAHHGSRSSSTASFLDRYGPLTAIVSAGAGNRFGHPAPEVVRRLDLAHVRLWRTDRDGAITIETDGRAMRVRTWTGTRWAARLLEARPP
jgi:competence protein ComEC